MHKNSFSEIGREKTTRKSIGVDGKVILEWILGK
jgi:hypothetical protein